MDENIEIHDVIVVGAGELRRVRLYTLLGGHYLLCCLGIGGLCAAKTYLELAPGSDVLLLESVRGGNEFGLALAANVD